MNINCPNVPQEVGIELKTNLRIQLEGIGNLKKKNFGL